MSLLTPAGARGTPESGEAEATPAGAGTSLLEGYDVGRFFDEMLEPDGRPRPHYRALHERLGALTDEGSMSGSALPTPSSGEHAPLAGPSEDGQQHGNALLERVERAGHRPA